MIILYVILYFVIGSAVWCVLFMLDKQNESFWEQKALVVAASCGHAIRQL